MSMAYSAPSIFNQLSDHLPRSCSIICSSIDMIDDILWVWRFLVSHRWHSTSCSLKNILCWSLEWYVSILICLAPFWSTVFTLSMSISTPVWSAHHPVVLCWHWISISCLLLPLLFVLQSQQHFLPSMFPFSRQLGATYFPTMICSMLLAVLFPCIHFALIFMRFLHLLFLDKVSHRLLVSLAFTLIWVLF